MQYRLIIALLAIPFATNTCVAQVAPTVGRDNTQTVTARREGNMPDNNNYTNTRETIYNAPQRQEVANTNIAPERLSPITRNYNEPVGYNTSLQNYNEARQYNTGKTSNGYTTLNNAYPQPSHNNYINPGGGSVRARYNPAAGKYYYYSSSDYTKRKCNNVCNGASWGAGGNIPEHFRFGSGGQMYAYWPCAVGTVMYNPMCLVDKCRRDILLLPDNTAKHSNSSQFYSFDGYIVYNTDTIPGIVTITHNAVTLEKPVNHPERKYYDAALNDPLLKAIVVYKGPKELHLVRLASTDKHLSRMVHNGKLMLYDRSYNFLTADNIDNNLRAINPVSGEQMKVKNKQELTAAVNKAYSLNIQPEALSKKELIHLINRLD